MAPELDILQVITTSARRGAERFAAALEPELVERGLVVRTVALTAGEPPRLDVEPLGPNRLGPATLVALRSAARSARVVVAHGSTTLPASWLATRGTGIPFVYRNIGDPGYWSTSRSRRLRSRLLLGGAAAVVALTQETGARLTEYYGVPTDRITPIPRGVSTGEFPRRTAEDRHRARVALQVGAETRLLACIGALSPEKDVANAVAALAHLPERWHLIVAGDGPERVAVEREVASVAPGRVRLLGQIANPSQLLTAADLLVVPSRTEGLPGVVIEAGLTGVPAVVTDVGFVRHLVDPEVSGHIVAPGDPEALAAAVIRSEDHLEAMGAAAHARLHQEYSLSSVAQRWYDLLAPFCGRAEPAPAGSRRSRRRLPA